MVDIGDKLREFRESLGLSRRAFADQIGVPEGKIQKIEMGAQRADHDILSKMGKIHSLDLHWLLGVSAATDRSADVQLFPDDLAVVPVLSVSASAGAGSQVDWEEVIDTYPIKRSWLDRHNLNEAALSFISVVGDSMEPDFTPGDLVLIDHQEPRDGKWPDGQIYAVRYSDSLLLKRLQYMPGGKLNLISSNKHYAPVEVSDPKSEEVIIVGRAAGCLRHYPV